jgi:putative hydrolase of the HAD superfamily
MQTVKHIIFDLGGVLLNLNYQATEDAFTQLGITRFSELFNQFHSNDLFSKLETGTTGIQPFLDALQQELPTRVTHEQIIHAWNAMLLDFRTDSIAFLKEIRNRYRIFLLSNTNEIHLQFFQESFQNSYPNEPFDDLFEVAYYSHRIGLRKPNAEAYLYVLEQNNLAAADTLFIDDSLPNIEAAEKLGLQTVHLLPHMRIEKLKL